MSYKSRLGGVALCCLAALTSASRAQDAAPASGDGETYYLVGVAPTDARVVIAPGDLKAGKFAVAGAEPAALTPVDGFVLAKAGRAGWFAITGVQFIGAQEAPTSLVDLAFKGMESGLGIKDHEVLTPCGDGTTVAFELPAHKVIYIGTIQYSVSHVPYLLYPQFLVGADLDKARAFLQAKYPDLAGRVEQGAYQFRSLDRVCPK